RNFVIQRTNGSCVATVPHVIQLLIVDAVAGVNRGPGSASKRSPRHAYPWSEQVFRIILAVDRVADYRLCLQYAIRPEHKIGCGVVRRVPAIIEFVTDTQAQS